MPKDLFQCMMEDLMTGYLTSFLWKRAVKRAGQDPFEEFLKLIWVEDREDLEPLVGHDHDYCVVAQTDHNYHDRPPWDHDYCIGVLTPNNDNEKVPRDDNYSMQ